MIFITLRVWKCHVWRFLYDVCDLNEFLYGGKKDGLCFVLILQLFMVLNEFVVEIVNTKKIVLCRQNCGHVVLSLYND